MPPYIIPNRWIEKRELREAENRVYQALHDQLTDDYVVIHDVHWIGDSRSPRTSDIQIDFIIAHPELGVIVLEVKGGGIIRKKNIWYQRTRERNLRGCLKIALPLPKAMSAL